LLGISAGLFIAYGAVWFLIGLLTPLLHDRGIGPTMLFISPRTDTALFGADPATLLSDPTLSRLRSLLLTALGGMLVAAGLMVMSIAFFALRSGQTWSLVTLTIVGIGVLPFWLLVFRPYLAAGIPIALGDVPPFMWVPTALLMPAVILGVIGLRQST
jgi:hypothetical protein